MNVSQENTLEKGEESSFRVSWSYGMLLGLLLLLMAFLVPVVVIICVMPIQKIPLSISIFAAVVVLLAVSTPIAILSLAPHVILITPSMAIRVLSLCGISLFSANINDVRSIERITFKEYIWSRRTRGWPTDWNRAVRITLHDASSFVVSLTDPDSFFAYIQSI